MYFLCITAEELGQMTSNIKSNLEARVNKIYIQVSGKILHDIIQHELVAFKSATRWSALQSERLHKLESKHPGMQPS